MSEAEERGYKAYPYNGDYRGQGDSNSKFREAYIKGYHQAEKDFELTWKDMMAVDDLLDELLPPRRDSDELVLKGYYEEVLKRFKERKEK